MSEGVGFSFGAEATAAQDDTINLDLGLGTTDGLATSVVPEGTHRFKVGSVDVNYTKDGEIMLNVPCTVVQTNVPEAMGATHTERLVIPGDERRNNDPPKWKIMMKMLRLRLEGITNRPWRDDNIKLSPNRDLADREFIATVRHEESVVEDEDGNEKKYTNSRLGNWVPITDGTNGMSSGPQAVTTATGSPASGSPAPFQPQPYDPAEQPF